ncbi:hypothetical protein ACFP1I_31265 [Dyadobacter subterraneus]|uniref:Uncharacterized protein n=1 Tax=Dyadobacter subterraneus TaxID=2773304 RepID=A0ABR9W9J2_9BACT|nr:hypothetical protein [Dyadobacter subterraneus]MBE9461799.1 hypothetical protein [Dyadobacter subterraneus]
MKRRNFIFCTALSVGSISTAFAASDKNLPSIENNLQQYLSAIGAYGELKFLCDDQLIEDFTLKSASYLQTGYKSYGLKYYFCSQQSVAVCPLVLTTDSSGIIDIAVLFFRKNSSNNWTYSNSFSGFHLESIVKALPELNQNYSTEQWADLLVPVQRIPGKTIPHTLFTKNGSLRLVVKIEDQKTLLDFSLTEKNSEIFAQQSLSDYSPKNNLLI